jgi:hypothetical protein
MQPALLGGLVMGTLSALPIVAAGNYCCCLWIVSGGFIAAYLLQQKQTTPITQGDGALVGLLAGIVGAFVYLLLSIPITFLIGPLQRELLQRLLDRAGNMPPEGRDLLSRYVGGPLGIVISFINHLVLGVVFSTVGGLLGAVVFRKPLPPGTIDVSPPA